MKFYRTWVRRLRWEAFGQTNKRIRELEIAYANVDLDDYTEVRWLEGELDSLRARSSRLRELLAPEV